MRGLQSAQPRRHLVMAACLACGMFADLRSQTPESTSLPVDASSFYPLDQLGVKRVELDGEHVKWTFFPESEQFYWCPGVQVQNTEKATVVTFVRCPTSESCATDVEAPIGRQMIRTVSVATGGKDLYIKNGEKKYKKVFDAKTGQLVSAASPNSPAPVSGVNGLKQSSTVRRGLPLRQPQRIQGPDKYGWVRNPSTARSPSSK